VKIVTGERMAEIDRQAMTEYGIPGLILMENAGLQVVNLLRELSPEIQSTRIVVLCGRGNNGGDGFVIARHLLRLGYRVEVWALGEVSQYKGDAQVNYNILLKNGINVLVADEGGPTVSLLHMEKKGIIVDALLGTGLKREVSEPFASIIKAINDSPARVVSVDIPSGISADNGQIMGMGVKADYTVTFALPKKGLFLFPGADYSGEIRVVDIGIPGEITSADDIKENFITSDLVYSLLPRRIANGHKGSYGRALILAGSPGMSGAAVLAGESALRGGAGLVYLGTAEEISSVLEAKLKEVIVIGFQGDGNGNLIADSFKKINKKALGCQAVAFGPGLVPNQETLELLKSLIEELSIPLVVDAGGLGALTLEPSFLPSNGAPLILTPHPGEMARLTGNRTDEVQGERWELTSRKALEWGAVVLLKGAYTTIALPDGELYVNPTGNPALSTAGTGDLLTGLITSLIAQGLSPGHASICGVFVHGLAADLLIKERGLRGHIAGDVLNYIPQAINKLLSGKDERDGR